MYGQMLRNVYYDGYNTMPFQSNNFSGVRQQPYPFMHGMNGVQQLNLNPYMNSQQVPNYPPMQEMNPYYFQPPVQSIRPQPLYQQQTNAPTSGTVFQNPLHPIEHTSSMQQQFPSPNPYMNPYPKASFLAKQPSGVKTVINSFKSQDGSLDINKMVDTAGQMMNAVTQVSTVVKGLGGIFKA